MHSGSILGDTVYLVNRPLRAAGMSAYNARGISQGKYPRKRGLLRDNCRVSLHRVS